MNKGQLLEAVEVIDTGHKGQALIKHQGRAIWVEKAVPGDVLDVRITGRRKKQWLGRVERIRQASPDRVEPFCQHFRHCGGCKWQNIAYSAQLRQKAKWVHDCLQRLGGLSFPTPRPIVPAPRTTGYRNKLDFAASARRWLTPDEIAQDVHFDSDTVGFHVSGHFDKVLQIEHCHLMPAEANQIRNGLREQAKAAGMPFFDPREQSGFFRSVVIRCSNKGEWMVLLVTAYEAPQWVAQLADYVRHQLPMVTTLYHVLNPKANDALFDCEHRRLFGAPCLDETVNGLSFWFGPKSFAQTNTEQAAHLYRHALSMLEPAATERVYDLYTGVGVIALQLAQRAGSVVGIESVPEAIELARQNAARNGIENAAFVCGSVEKTLQRSFFESYGRPQTIVLDPPRSGVHPKVMRALAESGVPRILYISCNPATQARDLALIDAQYHISALQPIDMFPHTYHVENIALLEKRST